MVAENIAFNPTTDEEVIVGLLVDDGVADRGHREVLFERNLFFAGVACGPHPSYGATCVIDYAASFESRGGRPRVDDVVEQAPSDDDTLDDDARDFDVPRARDLDADDYDARDDDEADDDAQVPSSCPATRGPR